MPFGTHVGSILKEQRRSVPRQIRLQTEDRPGINLVAYGTLASGVGEASGIVAQLTEAASIPTSHFRYDVYDAAPTGGASPPPVGQAAYPLTLSALNAPDHLVASTIFPRIYSPRRHRIGVWHWEVDSFPLLHRLAGLVVDEVWTTSVYQQEHMARQYGVPVFVLPLPVVLAPPDQAFVTQIRSLVPNPSSAIFAFQFDWNSSRRRKNPDGVVEAYLRAFPIPSPGTSLLIKTVNGSQHAGDLASLRARCRDRDDVVVVDEFWPGDLNASFSHAIDCYVSLHRAEGFGLTMAKAMAAGKPVVATGYSGNLDFMAPGTCLLVPSTLVGVGPDDVYPADGRWGEPDLDVAADMMRRVAADSALRAELGSAAGAHIASTRSFEGSVQWIRARLGELGIHSPI